MNKSICFIANFYKTPVFFSIASHLERSGVKIYWIVPKKSQYLELNKKYSSDHLLLIDRSLKEQNNASVGDFKLNEILYGDRVWRYNIKEGLCYLNNIQKPVYDFIKDNSISYVFGEVTWAHEILIHRICTQQKELKCCFYTDMVVRIPNNRFMFFSDEKKSVVVEKNKTINIPQSYLTLKIESPMYLSINNRLLSDKMSLKGMILRLKKFLTKENIEKTDPNVIIQNSVWLKIVFKEIFNQKRYKLISRAKPEILDGKKFILFGFHKQPEASIDVCGRYYEDQYQSVLNLWRQLPQDWYLVIKEHSNAIGDRSYSFFKSLLKYPNIILMNEHANSLSLIKNAQLVATNTGTMALEAALMDIPSITFSEVFFNRLNYCRHCTWNDFEKYPSLPALIQEIKNLPNNKDEYMKYVYDHSYEGMLTDVITLPSVLDPQSIHQLSNAIISVIDNDN